MRTRVKICGITREQDAEVACACGADAIGLVFYAASPRAVSVEQAERIVRGLPAFVTSVGLFVNPRVEEVKAILERIPLDCLQFHGRESADFCEQFGRPYIKAIRVAADTDVTQQARPYLQARAILLDAYVPDIPGGTGQAFDWHQIPATCPRPIILAGGLTPDNVGAAIRQVQPYAVDVSGGVEQSKGIKDQVKIQQFITEVNSIGAGKPN